jgi:hypothetical protein
MILGAAAPGCCDLVEGAVNPPFAVNYRICDDGSGAARAARRYSVLTATVLNLVGSHRSTPSKPSAILFDRHYDSGANLSNFNYL